MITGHETQQCQASDCQKNFNSLLKRSFSSGWSKTSRCKALEILRSEAYLVVRRNDEG